MMQGALIAVLLAVGFLGMAASRWETEVGDGFVDLRDRASAEQLETFRSGAEDFLRYVKGQVKAEEASPGSATIMIDGQGIAAIIAALDSGDGLTVPVSALVQSRFLPDYVQDRNAYGQRYVVVARRMGGAGSDQYAAVIVTEGGRAITDRRVSQVAASSGVNAGVIAPQGAEHFDWPDEGASDLTIRSTAGGWDYEAIDQELPTVPLQRGRLAGLLDVGGAEYQCGYSDYVCGAHGCEVDDSIFSGGLEPSGICLPHSNGQCPDGEEFATIHMRNVNGTAYRQAICLNGAGVPVDLSFCGGCADFTDLTKSCTSPDVCGNGSTTLSCTADTPPGTNCTWHWRDQADATPAGCGQVTPVRTYSFCYRNDNAGKQLADSFCTSASYGNLPKTENLPKVDDYRTCTYDWASHTDATPKGCGWVTPVRTYKNCTRSDPAHTVVADSTCTGLGKPKTVNLPKVFATDTCTVKWSRYEDGSPTACDTPVSITRTFYDCVREQDNLALADQACINAGFAKTQVIGTTTVPCVRRNFAWRTYHIDFSGCKGPDLSGQGKGESCGKFAAPVTYKWGYFGPGAACRDGNKLFDLGKYTYDGLTFKVARTDDYGGRWCVKEFHAQEKPNGNWELVDDPDGCKARFGEGFRKLEDKSDYTKDEEKSDHWVKSPWNCGDCSPRVRRWTMKRVCIGPASS